MTLGKIFSLNKLSRVRSKEEIENIIDEDCDKECLKGIYKYKNDNQIRELFIILNFENKDDISDSKNIIKGYNDSIRYYINFMQNNTKLYYNTYIIILISEKQYIGNKDIIRDIMKEKLVARKIFLYSGKNSLLPFIDEDNTYKDNIDEEIRYSDKLYKYNKTVNDLENTVNNIDMDIDKIIRGVLDNE